MQLLCSMLKWFFHFIKEDTKRELPLAYAQHFAARRDAEKDADIAEDGASSSSSSGRAEAKRKPIVLGAPTTDDQEKEVLASMAYDVQALKEYSGIWSFSLDFSEAQAQGLGAALHDMHPALSADEHLAIAALGCRVHLARCAFAAPTLLVLTSPTLTCSNLCSAALRVCGNKTGPRYWQIVSIADCTDK